MLVEVNMYQIKGRLFVEEVGLIEDICLVALHFFKLSTMLDLVVFGGPLYVYIIAQGGANNMKM